MSLASPPPSRRALAEIACVVVNPLQGFNPNSPPPNDMVLMTASIRKAASGKTLDNYAVWLKQLRQTCTEANVPLMFDEVYTGFRMAPGGGQEYYGVNADMVAYGKTLGGGLPVGVVCGKKELMRRFDPERSLRVSYVIGTFAAHPLTMGSMNAAFSSGSPPRRLRRRQDCGGRFRRLDRRHQRRAQEGTAPHQRAQPHHGVDHHLRSARAVPLDAAVLPPRRGHRHVGWARVAAFSSAGFHQARSGDAGGALLRAAKRMRDDGWWYLGTAEEPINAQTIQRAMGKEMAYNTVMKIIREGLLAEILCLPEQSGPRAPKAVPPRRCRSFTRR